MKTSRLLFTSLFSLLIACAPFQDSPYSDQLFHPDRNLNIQAIDRIKNIESDGKVRIAVFADSHQNYEELNRIIFDINQTDNIDFVANLGDFTNSSYNFEYDQFLNHYLYLKYPAVSVIGNHDAIGAGPSLFKKAFGPLNQWFESTSTRFILFHSANLEYQKDFDVQWLYDAVNSSAKPVIIFTHVPLKDPERFFGDTATTLLNVINHPNTNMILNGHNHVYAFGTENNTVLLQCPRAERKIWLLLEIQGNQLTITQMPTGVVQSITLKN